MDESGLNVLHVIDGLVHGVEVLEHFDTGFGVGGGGTDEGKSEWQKPYPQGQMNNIMGGAPGMFNMIPGGMPMMGLGPMAMGG